MKIYVLLEDWNNKLDSGTSILGAYQDGRRAREGLNEKKEEYRRELDEYDTEIEWVDGYERYRDGEYLLAHAKVWVEEIDLK